MNIPSIRLSDFVTYFNDDKTHVSRNMPMIESRQVYTQSSEVKKKPQPRKTVCDQWLFTTKPARSEVQCGTKQNIMHTLSKSKFKTK
jgi:hypothetical protein